MPVTMGVTMGFTYLHNLARPPYVPLSSTVVSSWISRGFRGGGNAFLVMVIFSPVNKYRYRYRWLKGFLVTGKNHPRLEANEETCQRHTKGRYPGAPVDFYAEATGRCREKTKREFI